MAEEGTTIEVFESTSLLHHIVTSVSSLDDGHQTRATIGGTQLTCLACGVVFSSRSEQAAHYKTAEHQTNLRRRVLRKPPLRQPVSGDGDSAADCDGGENDDDDDDDDDDDEEDQNGDEEEEDEDDVELEDEESADAHPWWWLKAGEPIVCVETLEDDSVHSIELNIALVAQSRKVLVASGSAGLLAGLAVLAAKSRPRWGVLILRSGRFAGGLFAGKELLEHKTYKRYTIRKGQGGSQAAMDGTGKKPKSAGAMLRRHGEQMLRTDVRTLIGKEWAERMTACDLVFVSAPRSMRAVLFGGGHEAPLQANDARNRTVPFMVQKPTLKEVKRVHQKLSELKYFQVLKLKSLAWSPSPLL